jgi:hypothetical protein
MCIKSAAVFYWKSLMRSWDTFVINVVNRHKDKAIEAEISNTSGNFSGNPSANEISAADLTARYLSLSIQFLI